jgi:Glycosyl hydrolase family 20, catalytic domain
MSNALSGEIPALAELGVNVLVAEVNYYYAYASHPELREPDPIRRETIQGLVRVCREHAIRLIPQFQCLGHQSWKEYTFALLRHYPEFDETPGQYPHNAGIYCRSWCPHQPALLPIVFDLIDELLEVFQADALHVGMDEVLLIAAEHCPRCRGENPAELFAQAVCDYYAQLVAKRGVEMLMWGDRLLDDRVMGYGEWEAAQNNTSPAIQRIPRDVIICDWHYELREAYPSVPFFLDKGFRVLPAGWQEPEAVGALIDYARRYQDPRLLGYLCTTWNAVKPGELATWPPLAAAMNK